MQEREFLETNMKSRSDTFVVRIFCEDEGKFKGNVQHLSTRNQIRFDNFESMDEFILSHTTPCVKPNKKQPEITPKRL